MKTGKERKGKEKVPVPRQLIKNNFRGKFEKGHWSSCGSNSTTRVVRFFFFFMGRGRLW